MLPFSRSLGRSLRGLALGSGRSSSRIQPFFEVENDDHPPPLPPRALSVQIYREGVFNGEISIKELNVSQEGWVGDAVDKEEAVRRMASVNIEAGGHVEEKKDMSLSPDEWLPLTESRKGNIYSSVFHLVTSGIGMPQAVVLPLAFVALGWAWGVIFLLLAFAWQLYTMWLLVQLHEAPSGSRISRYLHLAIVSFGPKWGKLLALFPVGYLAGATCASLIISVGAIMKPLLLILCGDEHQHCNPKALTVVEWHLVFVTAAILIALLLPNLNSVAWVSLIGATMAIAYCSLLWILPLSKSRPSGISYSPTGGFNNTAQVMSILAAFGTNVFAYRGHNVVLEIEGTLPSSTTNPPRKTMWRAVIISYIMIAICLVPLAIAGYWAYGTMMPAKGEVYGFVTFHEHGRNKTELAIIYFMVIINSLCLYQIYGMVMFDTIEMRLTGKTNKPLPRWQRAAVRCFFGGVTFFISVALPFLPKLAPLIGGMALPLTFVYPCFFWIIIKKPAKFSRMWWSNWVLGCAGIILTVLVVTSAIYNLAKHGLYANFFHPK
ncbi:hypothetical protein Ancab_017288 [Ancistrocladus abbreviatus]